MMIACRNVSVIFWPTMRATMSEPPPGAYGTTMRMGFVGYEGVLPARCESAAAASVQYQQTTTAMLFAATGSVLFYGRPYPNLLSLRVTYQAR
jgi:hypothetical protein